MKTHKYLCIIGVLLGAMSLTSCDDFLEEDPKDMKGSGQFWKLLRMRNQLSTPFTSAECPI